jgi:hypothetical protein
MSWTARRDIFAAPQKYHRLWWLFALFWDVRAGPMPEPIKKPFQINKIAAV